MALVTGHYGHMQSSNVADRSDQHVPFPKTRQYMIPWSQATMATGRAVMLQTEVINMCHFQKQDNT